MEHEGERAERNNRQHGESSLHPKQFAVEGHQLRQILFPAQTRRYLRACNEQPFDDGEAIAVIQGSKALAAPSKSLAKTTIKKIAQEHRDEVFRAMDGKGRAQLGEQFLWAFPGWRLRQDGTPDEAILAFMRAHEVDAGKIGALRAYIRKKSPRVDRG